MIITPELNDKFIRLGAEILRVRMEGGEHRIASFIEAGLKHGVNAPRERYPQDTSDLYLETPEGVFRISAEPSHSIVTLAFACQFMLLRMGVDIDA